MRKTLLVFICIALFFPLKAQLKLVRHIWVYDSAYHEGNYTMNGYWLGWQNWKLDNLPEHKDADVYYDNAHQHLGLSVRWKNTDTGWAAVSEKEFYLNGKCASQNVYDNRGALLKNITYDITGDTMMVHSYFPGTEFRSYARSKVNRNKTYLSWMLSYGPGQYDAKELSFAENGDTLHYKVQAKDHKFNKDITYRSGHRILITRLDSADHFVFRPVTYSQPEEIFDLMLTPKTKSKADSLKYYVNLKTLSLQVNERDTTGMAAMLNSLEALSALTHLESIDLHGPFQQLPSAILKCKNLTSLSVYDTKIKIIPSGIASLMMLHSLYIVNNDSLDYSSSLKNLSVLNGLHHLVMPLDFNKPLPANIVLLKHLWTLSLGNYSICTRDSSPPVDVKLIYQLKELRDLDICWDQYCKTDLFEFARRLPNCMVRAFETCFDRNSLVTLVNGHQKMISDIKVGDILLGYDESAGRLDTTIVSCVHIHQKPLAGGITFRYSSLSGGMQNAGAITTTAIHPFYVNGHWMKAGDVHCGDLLTTESGLPDAVNCSVEEVEWNASISEEVYNLTTTNHTFFVNGVLVHNK